MPTPMPDVALFSEGFSTAFRKALGTPLSSLACSAIRGLRHEDWETFVTHVMAGMARRGGFDAGNLRDACLDYAQDWAVISPRARAPAEESLLHVWRDCLGMMTAVEWLEATLFVRSGMNGDDAEALPDALSLVPTRLASDVVTLTVTRAGTEVARLTSRVSFEGEGAAAVRVVWHDVAVLGDDVRGRRGGGLAEALEDALDAAAEVRAKAKTYRVDVERARALALAPMGFELSPDVPSDAALIAHGVTGTVVQRKPTGLKRGASCVQYVTLAAEADGLTLHRWVVRPGTGSPVIPGSSGVHGRTMDRVRDRGFCRLGTEVDSDETYAVSDLRQEDGRVTWSTRIMLRKGHPLAGEVPSLVLAEAQGAMAGVLVGHEAFAPIP